MVKVGITDGMYLRSKVPWGKGQSRATWSRLPSLSQSEAAKGVRARFGDAARSSKGAKGKTGGKLNINIAVGNKLRGGR